MKHLPLLIVMYLVTLFTSCNKDWTKAENQDLPHCIDLVLKQYEMKLYDGQERFCYSLHWYIYDNKDYFYDDCCICDKDFNPFDCEGNKLFYYKSEPDTLVRKLFHSNSTYKGIIGIL